MYGKQVNISHEDPPHLKHLSVTRFLSSLGSNSQPCCCL